MNSPEPLIWFPLIWFPSTVAQEQPEASGR